MFRILLKKTLFGFSFSTVVLLILYWYHPPFLNNFRGFQNLSPDTSHLTLHSWQASASSGTPIVMYAVSNNFNPNSQNSLNPDTDIFFLSGNNPAQKIISTRNIPVHSGTVQISPDRQFVYINFADHLSRIDLRTGKSKIIFQPQSNIFSVVLSPDGNFIFIIDRIGTRPSDTNHLFRILNLTTSAIKNYHVNYDLGNLFAVAWHPSGKIILGLSGTPAPYFYFDPVTQTIAKSPTNATFGPIHSSGTKIIKPIKTVPYPCPSANGTLDSLFEVAEPVTGQIFGTFGTNGMSSEFRAFSPDGNLVLYQAFPPPATASQCDKPQSPSWYISDLSAQTNTPVSWDQVFQKPWENFVGFTPVSDPVTHFLRYTNGSQSLPDSSIPIAQFLQP